MGYGMGRFGPNVDVVIGGENPETGGGWDLTEYVLDAASLGFHKGQISFPGAAIGSAGVAPESAIICARVARLT